MRRWSPAARSLTLTHMPNYRRLRVPAGTYFFTVNLADRSRRLLMENIDALRMGVAAVRVAHPFETVAWCVLPDHLHVVCGKWGQVHFLSLQGCKAHKWL